MCTLEVSTGSSWFLLGIFSVSIYSLPIPIPCCTASTKSCCPGGVRQRETLWVGCGGANPSATRRGEAVPSDAWGMLLDLPSPSIHAGMRMVPSTRRDSASPWPGLAPLTLLLKAKTPPGTSKALSQVSLLQRVSKLTPIYMHNPLCSNLSIYLCSLLVQEMSIGFKYNNFFINKEQATLLKGKPDVYLGLLCFLLLSIVCGR